MKLREIQNTELSLIFFNKNEEQIIEYLYADVQETKQSDKEIILRKKIYAYFEV